MKEIELKLKELNEKLERINSSIENVKNHIEFLKKEKLDYLDWVIKNGEFRSEKQTLLIKIDTLEKAKNVLLGIEI